MEEKVHLQLLAVLVWKTVCAAPIARSNQENFDWG